MNITIGRGSKRKVYVLPAGGFMRKADEAEYRALFDNILAIMRERGVRFAGDESHA